MPVHPPNHLPPWPDLLPFQPVLEAADIVGLFEWDLQADHIRPCLGMTHLFGLDRSCVLADAPSIDFLPALHPDDRGRFIEREKHATSRMRHRLTDEGGQARLIDETARYRRDAQGRSWAYGVLFERPVKRADAFTQTADSAQLAQAAQLAIDLAHTLRDIDASTLHTLLKLVLVEIGTTLARVDRPLRPN